MRRGDLVAEQNTQKGTKFKRFTLILCASLFLESGTRRVHVPHAVAGDGLRTI